MTGKGLSRDRESAHVIPRTEVSSGSAQGHRSLVREQHGRIHWNSSQESHRQPDVQRPPPQPPTPAPRDCLPKRRREGQRLLGRLHSALDDVEGHRGGPKRSAGGGPAQTRVHVELLRESVHAKEGCVPDLG